MTKDFMLSRGGDTFPSTKERERPFLYLLRGKGPRRVPLRGSGVMEDENGMLMLLPLRGLE